MTKVVRCDQCIDNWDRRCGMARPQCNHCRERRRNCTYEKRADSVSRKNVSERNRRLRARGGNPPKRQATTTPQARSLVATSASFRPDDTGTGSQAFLGQAPVAAGTIAEPGYTSCINCWQILGLVQDGYSINGGPCLCAACHLALGV